MMQIFFIACLFFAVYSYLVYPCVLLINSKGFRKPWSRKDIKPSVSIIISAHNEEDIIAEKIQNALELEYPGELLEIIVSSDGSTDRTDEIVSNIGNARVILYTFDRIGKTACLNKTAPSAKGEIILFTDANSIFPVDLLIKMVRNFYDTDVGLVTGWTKYRSRQGGKETTGIYAKLEKWTKYRESLISSCVGADGAVFAIRKSLFQFLDENDINDFVIPLQVIAQGKRVVMDPEVFCIEVALEADKAAFRRQIRITNRTLSAIRRNLKFLGLRKFGSFSFFLISHKIIRLFVPFFAIFAFIFNLFILNKSMFYILTLLGQLTFLSLGLLDVLGILNGRISSICKFFILTLAAQLIGLIRMIFGIEDKIWTPQR